MDKMNNHTDLPWSEDCELIDVKNLQDEAFALTACNNFYRMKEFLVDFAKHNMTFERAIAAELLLKELDK